MSAEPKVSSAKQVRPTLVIGGVVAVYLAFVPYGIYAKADFIDEIRLHCANEWDADYEMQEYCINQQTAAANNVIGGYNKLRDGSEEKNIYIRCLDQWQSDVSGYDWEMVKYCTEKQLDAYGRIGPSSR